MKGELNKESEDLHDMAVMKIAEELFAFPRSEFVPGVFHPTWATYTNVPERRMPIEHKWMGELYPDITVVDKARGNMPMLIAEVETKKTLTLEEALEQKWIPDKNECSTLYIFVPEGYAQDAANLILDYRVCFPTALFTYGFDKEGNLRLTPV